ncbi:MAG: hypothetical protein ACI4AB_06765 [Acetatifactor sp.]
MEKKKTEKGWILLGGCIIVLLAVWILWQADVFGVSKQGMEKDIRRAMNIDSGWELAQAVNEDMGAMLLYSPERDDYTYAVYLNREGFSFGYFFREGGIGPYISDGVQEIIYEDRGTVLLSMNADGISRIVADNSVMTQVVEIDPNKPFVVVFPTNCGEITMYNLEGNVVEGKLYDRFTG